MIPADAVRDVMRRHPELTWHGFEEPGAVAYNERRAKMLHPAVLQEFERAVAWLLLVPRRKVPNRKCGSSYGIKHTAERWAGGYIGNGMLLCAALHLRLAVARCPYGPNGWLAISSRRKWPKPIGCE